MTRTIWSIKLLAPFERGADGEAPPRQVKTARRLVVPIRQHSTTPRARLGLDRRGKLAAAARATKEGLDKKHSILRAQLETSRGYYLPVTELSQSNDWLIVEGEQEWMTQKRLLRSSAVPVG